MSGFKSFVDLIYKIEDQELLEDLMVGITTEKERHDFVQRLEITKRLIAGDSQKKIAKDLGVGVATVTRGSKELSLGRFKILR